jgi:S1-C subfamily serine protease
LSFVTLTKPLPAALCALFIASAHMIALGQSGVGRGGKPAPTPSTISGVTVVEKTGTRPVAATTPLAATNVKTAQTPFTQPPQVVSIIHRLGGWKLRMWLAYTDAKVLDPATVNQFVYTNIVAGYLLGDGRSVVARLPEADAEMLNLPAAIGFSPPSKKSEELSALMMIRRDGARLDARFIGLDGSTGLTLLEADGLGFQPTREAAENGLAIGQRVRLFAPVRSRPAQAVAGVGNGGSVYMRVEEIKGTITEIARASTGSLTRLTVRAEGLSPQIIGGVVLNEAGETVGLVETSARGEARVMPAAIIKRAAERVSARRASVPRPLLGVRGEAISMTTLKQLETAGWKLEEAHKLLSRQLGVLLTMVSPKSPAALADLRAGDIIVRINDGEVKNTEDFSFLLNKAGGGASVQFTVLRAAEIAPREVTIKLSEAFNLRRATEMSINGFRGDPGLYAAAVADSARATARGTVDALGINPANPGPVGAVTPAAAADEAVRPDSLIADLDYIVVPTDKTSSPASYPSVLLVNVVRPESSAARLGLRAGDVIISVNGQMLTKNEWPEKFLLRRASTLSVEVMRGTNRITLKYEKK